MPNPGFGSRDAFTTRVPVDHAVVFRAAAQARGRSMSDYIAELLAEAHSLPSPPWLRPADDQQEVLPESA